MKRFLFLLLLSLILTSCILLSSCTADEGGGANSPSEQPEYNNDDITFDIGEVVNIVISGEPSDNIQRLKTSLFHALGKAPNILTLDKSSGKNQLIIGKSDSPLSERAYAIMDRTDKVSEYQARITVYSDGKSVAVAYDIPDTATDYSDIVLCEAVDFFTENYVSDNKAINFKKGFSATHTFDVLADIIARDEAKLDEAWAKIEETAGSEAVKELRNMYEMFSPDVLSWLADLYDLESGGFYYANSGRNHDGFLPDIESTAQAIDLLRLSGCFDEYGDDPAKALPDWFKAKLVAFVKGLQDPNGYFYHPQWTHAMVDARISRKSRDLTKGLELLRSLGAAPTYDILDVKGDGILSDGTHVGFDKPILFNRVTTPIRVLSSAVAVSKIVPTAAASVPQNLASKDAFVSYLNGLDLNKNSYTIGNDIASQSAEIKARDEYLASIGASYRLKDILQDWLFSNCYETTGHWQPVANYDGLNGFMKISAACVSLGIPLKYPEAAVRSAINAITTDEYNETVCYAYNAWFSLNNIIGILNKCHPKAEAEAIIASIRAELKERAPELIKATAEKQSIFLREDGSFSYTETSTSPTSQGMPVAVPGTLEGDINATLICLADTAHQMFAALGYARPPIFGQADLFRFLDQIAELSPIIKSPEEIVVEVADFDDEKLGYEPESVKISNSTASTFTVIKDTRPGASINAKVLEFDAKSGGGKRVRLEMDLSANPLSRCYVFEGEFNFMTAPDSGMFATLQVGPSCYLVSFEIANGEIYLYEQSSDGANSKIVDLKTSIPLGEWFKLKVEYFYASADEVRIKLYVNDKLISISDNYYDRDGEKLDGGKPNPDSRYEGTDFFIYSYYDARVLLDNWKCYKKNEQYKPHLDPLDQPLFNIDQPDKDEIVYDFEGDTAGALPTSPSISGAASVTEDASGKQVSINGTAIATIPVNIRTASANATVLELDIMANTSTEGKIFDITFTEDARAPHDIVKYNAEIVDLDGDKFLILYAAPAGTSELRVEGVKIPVGESQKLRIEYYDGVRVALFYLDSELVGACDLLCQNAKKYTVGRVVISTGSKASVTFDNIVVEKIKKSFDTATKPGIDSVIHDFDEGLGELITSGNASVVGSLDKHLVLSSGGSLKIPANHRSVITNLVMLNASIILEGANDGVSYDLSFVDSEGKPVIAFEIRIENGKAAFYEKTEKQTYIAPLCYVTKGHELSLSILYYPLREIAYIISGGTAIAKTQLPYSDENKLLTPEFAIIESTSDNGSFVIDDIKFETTNDTYLPRDVASMENTEDKSEQITFEGSSSGNIPSSVTPALSSADSSIAVREMFKKTERSKVLEFNTRPGRQDAISFDLTKELSGYNTTVFEAEFKFTFKPNKVTSFQLFLEDGENTAYIINLSKKDDTITYTDLSSLKDNKIRGIDLAIDGAEEWHKIRIEYYNGSRDTVRIKTYVDDQLVRVSDNFGGKEDGSSTPLSFIKTARIMSYGDTYATLFLDNVSLVQADLKCADDPLTDGTTPTPPTPPTPPVNPEPDEPDEPVTPPADEDMGTLTFEDEIVGSVPNGVTSDKNDAYSYIAVANDPVNAANRVLKFYKANTTPENSTPNKSWPIVTISRTGTASEHNATVFEADFFVEYIKGRLDTTYTFHLGPKTAPAYAFRMNFGTERFNFIDSSNDNAGISSPTVVTASTTGQWFNLRIEFFEGDQNTVKILVYMDNALIYVSRNFYGPMSTDAAGKKYTVNNDISEFRISTWGDTQGIVLIDNASLYETTLKYPANPIGVPSGKVYPDAETEDFDAKVLPIKGGANGIITLNTDISADKPTITVLDRVVAKYNLKADIAVVVDNLMIGAGEGTNTEEKAPNTDIISFLNDKLAGGRLKIMNHGLTHVFWADTETGENIDWDFLRREFIGSKYLLRELFPSQKVKTFVIPGYAWIVDMFGEQIYDEVYEVLKDEYVASRYYAGTGANLYDWAWEKTPAHQILPGNDEQTYAVIDSVARGEGRFANLFLYHLDEDENFDNKTTNSGSETYFYQRESRLDAICKKISSYVETGAIWQTNYEDAMLYLREAENTTLNITRGENITLTLEDGLDDEIYDYPLTVRVQLDESYEAVKVTQNGKVSYAIVRAQNGIYFADCDVVPNSREAVIERASLEDIPEDMLPDEPEYNDGSVDFGGENKDDDAWTDAK